MINLEKFGDEGTGFLKITKPENSDSKANSDRKESINKALKKVAKS